MMLYDIAQFLHGVAVLLFGGYILLDRALFRRFFDEGGGDAALFYRLSRPVTGIAVGLLLLSGGTMVLIDGTLLSQPLFYLKLLLAGLLIAMFFYCPLFARAYGPGARRLYRAVVLILLLALLVVSGFFI